MTASAPDRDRERAEAAASALTLRSRLRAALMDRAIAITASVTAEPGPGAPRKALGAVVAEGEALLVAARLLEASDRLDPNGGRR